MTLKPLKPQKVFKARKGAHDDYYLLDRRSVPADSGNSVSDAICGKHTVSRLPDPFYAQRCLDQDNHRNSPGFLHPDRDRNSGRNDDLYSQRCMFWIFTVISSLLWGSMIGVLLKGVTHDLVWCAFFGVVVGVISFVFHMAARLRFYG